MTKPRLYFICSRKSSLLLPSIHTCFASTTFRDIRIQVLWGPWNHQAQYKMAFRDSPTRSSGNCLLLLYIFVCFSIDVTALPKVTYCGLCKTSGIPCVFTNVNIPTATAFTRKIGQIGSCFCIQAPDSDDGLKTRFFKH